MHTPSSPRSVLYLALLGLTACDGLRACSPGNDDEGDTGEVEHEQPCGDPTRATPPTEELCPPERQVAYLPALPECPGDPSSGWVVEELFASSTVPEPLTHYCRYLWTDPNLPPELGALPLAAQGQTQPDCRVTVQAPLDVELAPHYEAAFERHVWLATDLDTTLGAGMGVEIAVVDTAPSATSDGQAAHGQAIAAIVAKVASGCVPGLDGQTCERHVTTRLGLPQVAGAPPNPQLGGYFGYQSDLAEGIVAALDSWDRSDNLIVNLSVGWEPSLGDLGDVDIAPSAAIEAVRSAVELATCQGALVIAASGNQPPGSCVDAPMAPASWERLPGLDQDHCLELGLPSEFVELGLPGSFGYHPLVHAATPIDWRSNLLADFRRGSDARVVAPGFAGFVEWAGETHGTITGSSVAAATVSGTAALVWSYFPALSADEVMQLVYDSGRVRLDANQASVMASHFLTGTTAPEQHEITACGAILHACTVQGTCGVAAEKVCGEPVPGVDIETEFWSGFDQALTHVSGRTDDLGPEWDIYDCDRCGGESISLLPMTSSLLAGSMSDPWVLPQPEKPPCPMCEIKDDDIYLSLDPLYGNDASLVLLDTEVTLYDATGSSEVIHYTGLTLTTNLSVIADPELATVGRSGQPPTQAWVTMVFDRSTATGATERVVAGNQIPVD